MAKALNDLAHVPKHTHAEKKSLMLKIAPTWRQLAHAAPKLRAKTFEKFLDETFLASTRSCCTSVSLFVPVHARRTRTPTNICSGGVRPEM